MSAPTLVVLVLVLELVPVRELRVPVGAATRGAVVVRDEGLLVGAEGFLRVDVVDAVVGLVAVLDGDEASPLGRTEERRAADVIVDFFLSSSDTESCDLWFVVEEALAGFLTAAPAGGRVGGLLRLLPARAAAPAAVLAAAAVAVAVPGRRTAVVVLPGRFAAAEAVEGPVLVEEAGDFAVALGDAVAVSLVFAVPVVSSPERMDSSCCTTSKPSASDMAAGDRAW